MDLFLKITKKKNIYNYFYIFNIYYIWSQLCAEYKYFLTTK